MTELNPELFPRTNFRSPSGIATPGDNATSFDAADTVLTDYLACVEEKSSLSSPQSNFLSLRGHVKLIPFNLHCVILFDTGAGGNFLQLPCVMCEDLTHPAVPSPMEVVVADSSTIRSESYFEVNVSFPTVDGKLLTFSKVPIRILEVSEKSPIQLLLGRRFQMQYGFTMPDANTVCLGNEMILGESQTENLRTDLATEAPEEMTSMAECVNYILSVPAVNFYREELIATAKDPEIFNQDYLLFTDGHDIFSPAPSSESLHTCELPDDLKVQVVQPHLSVTERKVCYQILDDLSQEDWYSVLATEGYRIRFRAIDSKLPQRQTLIPGAELDTREQLYQCEIQVPKFNQGKLEGLQINDFSAASFRKLSPTLQQEFRAQVLAYVDEGWWFPMENLDKFSTKDDQISPYSPVFLIEGKRPRIVVDFRGINSLLPPASSKDIPVWVQLASMKLLMGSCCVIADARSAFYKNILTNTILCMRTPFGCYGTRRLAFGLSSGPCVLSASLGVLVAKVKKASADLKASASIFVDDAIITGVPIDVLRFTSRLVHCMLLSGFDVTQKKFSVTASPSEAAKVSTKLQECRLPAKISPAVSFLSCKISYPSDTHVSFDCDHTSRFNVLRNFCARVDESGNVFATPVSKRNIFAIAGCLGYDVSGLHPHRRNIANVLRSLFGRKFSNLSWSKTVDFSSFSQDEKNLYNLMYSWIKKELDEFSPCDHRFPLYKPGDLLTLELCTDASLHGGGSSITLIDAGGQRFPVLLDSYRWKQHQKVYHSNHLELIALFHGLRAFSQICEALISHPLSRPRLAIRIYSDNQPTISWVKGASQVKVASFRAISRLVLNANAEISFLREHSESLEIFHLSGEENSEADHLSRWWDYRLGRFTIGEILARGQTDAPHLEIGNNSNKIGSTDPDYQIDLTEADSGCLVQVQNPERDYTNFLRTKKTSKSSVLPISAGMESLGVPHLGNARVVNPLIERVAGLNRDFHGVRRDVAYLAFCFKVWKSYSAKEDRILGCYGDKTRASRLTIPTKMTDLVVARLSQHSDGECTALLAGRLEALPDSTVRKREEEGIQFLITPYSLPNGKVVPRFYLPKSCPIFRRLILRDVHRRFGHCGANSTFYHCDTWAIPSGKQTCKEIVRDCLVCLRLRSRLAHFEATSILCHFDPKTLSTQPAYYACGIDFLFLGSASGVEEDDEVSGKLQVMTFTCYFSHHTTWIACRGNPSVDLAIHCMERALVRLPGQVRFIVSDGPYYFRSQRWLEYLSEKGIEAKWTAPRAPSQGGFYEKLHGVGLERLRGILAHGLRKDFFAAGLTQQQLMVDKVTKMLNSRPITRPVDDLVKEAPLTPEAIVYGTPLEGGLLSITGQRSTDADISNVRSTYLDVLWNELFPRTQANTKAKKFLPDMSPGTPVLLYLPRANKLEAQLKLTHVEAQVSPHIYRVKGQTHDVSVHHLIPVPHLRGVCANDNDLSLGHRVGRKLKMRFLMTDRKVKWFVGRVVNCRSRNSVKVVWDCGDPASWHNLKTEVFRWIDDEA